MSQRDKSMYYRALKKAGIEFEQHYREYSTEDLQKMYHQLQENGVDIPLDQKEPKVSAPAPKPAPAPAPSQPVAAAPVQAAPPAVPVAPRPNNILPGERALQEREPLRVDEKGLIWYQEEVRKPAFPKPRGRRVLRYTDTGSKRVTVKAGEYTESFEIAGDERTREAEVKITLPSYQVGIYKDPRFPFKIHVYNELRGFDYFEVNNFYGGSEMIPEEVKKIYVQNVLCYDIRTVIREITTAARRLQLTGKADHDY